MLHYSTIAGRTLQLLKSLQATDSLQGFVLVGGTSLALQIGHRVSIDLDLFTSENSDIIEIINLVSEFGETKVINKSSKIVNLYIDKIKVDFVIYPYKFLLPSLETDELRLASIQDIAAMKLAAITGRGSRKDFIDLYFILDSFSLAEIMGFYNEKYPDGSEFLVFKSLLYFDDAELEPMPKMLKPVDWEAIKNRITTEVKTYFP